MKTLAATIAFATAFLPGTARPDQDVALSSGDPDELVDTLTLECGKLDVVVKGRFVYRTPKGRLAPVTDAVVFAGDFIWGEPLGDLERIDARVDSRGRFLFTTRLAHSRRTTEYVIGKAEVREVVVPKHFRIEAPGCASAMMTVSESWKRSDVELECPGR